MYLTDAQLNAGLDLIIPAGSNNARLSLHSAFSATGGNQIGSTTAATFSAASGGVKSLSAAVNIAVPSAATVRWIGVWDSAGTTFKGMVPNGGSPRTFQVDLTNDRILCEGHGYSNGDTITFYAGTPPGGLTEGTVYYVVGVSAGDPDSFQVAATQGGSAINLTGQHAIDCLLSRLVEETYSGAGTHTVNTLTISA